MRLPPAIAATACCATLLAPAAPAAAADDWPKLRQGLWQFDRTIDGMGPSPQKVSRTECLDPTANFRSQQQQLTRAGCTFTPVTRRGNDYRYGAACKLGGASVVSESVLTVASPEAYTLRVSSNTAGKVSKEVLTAKRVGDCAK